MNGDLLRLVDSIHRDKDIDREVIFDALEDALVSAARRHYGPKSDIAVFVDRETGEIQAFDGNEEIDAVDVGRIAAQTAKQVIIQKIRDAEQDALFRDYEGRIRQIVSGTIQRFEGSTIIVNLGRTEAILPRSEQVPEEGYRIGDRIRCYLLDVRRVGSRVRILLSRANPDFIRRLFELEVPEIAERVIEIMAIAREPGYRTKVAVASADSKVDCVGACVGVRGSRIKNIVAELNDEKIDIVRWSEARDMLIANSLKPAEVREVVVIGELNRARVVVPEDELSLAIGKRGRNVRLAAKLCDVDIDILSGAEAARELEEMIEAFGEIEDVPDRFAQRLFQMGYAVEDIAEGAAAWVERFDIPEEKANEVYERAREMAEILAERRAAEEAEAEAAEAEAAEAAAQAAGPEAPAAEEPEGALLPGEQAPAAAEPGLLPGEEAPPTRGPGLLPGEEAPPAPQPGLLPGEETQPQAPAEEGEEPPAEEAADEAGEPQAEEAPQDQPEAAEAAADEEPGAEEPPPPAEQAVTEAEAPAAPEDETEAEPEEPPAEQAEAPAAESQEPDAETEAPAGEAPEDEAAGKSASSPEDETAEEAGTEAAPTTEDTDRTPEA
ncbi:MAG: transcription termination factor NusA [Planctomycetota bacterium]